MDILSLIAGFLAGAVAIYLVSYFLKAEDGKNQKRAISSSVYALFDQLWEKHKYLLAEMKQDIESPGFTSHKEFYVLKKGWGWERWGLHRKGPRIAYFIEDHNDLIPLLEALATHGLINETDEVNKNSAKFEFTEQLIDLLRARK